MKLILASTSKFKRDKEEKLKMKKSKKEVKNN